MGCQCGRAANALRRLSAWEIQQTCTHTFISCASLAGLPSHLCEIMIMLPFLTQLWNIYTHSPRFMLHSHLLLLRLLHLLRWAPLVPLFVLFGSLSNSSSLLKECWLSMVGCYNALKLLDVSFSWITPTWLPTFLCFWRICHQHMGMDLTLLIADIYRNFWWPMCRCFV